MQDSFARDCPRWETHRKRVLPEDHAQYLVAQEGVVRAIQQMEQLSIERLIQNDAY